MISKIKTEENETDSPGIGMAEEIKKAPRRRTISASEKSRSLEELYLKDRGKRRIVKKKKSGRKMVWMFGLCLAIILVAAGAFVAIKFKDGVGKSTAVPEPVMQSEQVMEQVPAEVVVETPKEETVKIDIAALNVKALNAGAAAGLAGKVKTALVTQGYAKAEAGNGAAEGVVGNFVYYSVDNFQAEAVKISEFLATRNIKAGVSAAVTEEQKSADVVIILGK